MKYFVLKADSESSDHYAWIIKGNRKPSKKKIEAFLREECPCEYEDSCGPGLWWTLEEEKPVEL